MAGQKVIQRGRVVYHPPSSYGAPPPVGGGAPSSR